METKLEEPGVGDNSLRDLAAKIRAEHEATSAALKSSVQHAIAAGALLIEAKALVKHGQWLPWLAENCAISERTAQLYMRCAKSRAEIEANTQCVADLTLNEAAALLMLSSDVKKLLAFAKQIESADPDELIQLCAERGIAVISNNPFGAKEFSELDERDQLEWHLWLLYRMKASRCLVEEAAYYTDRLQSRGWSLAEWYGEMGDDYRRRWLGKVMPQSVKDEWRIFFETNKHRTVADVVAEIEQRAAQERERSSKRSSAPKKHRQRGPRGGQ